MDSLLPRNTYTPSSTTKLTHILLIQPPTGMNPDFLIFLNPLNRNIYISYPLQIRKEIHNSNSSTIFYPPFQFFTISTLTLCSSCGWCGERGTLLHLFIQCPAIQPGLNLLHSLLHRILHDLQLDFDLYWTLVPCARGRCREAVRLSNYLIVSFKHVIYWLYRASRFSNPHIIWRNCLQHKIIIDYHYFKPLQ